MPYYVSEPEFLPNTRASFPATPSDVLSASIGRTVSELPIPSVISAGQIAGLEYLGKPIDYSSAKARAEQAGVSLDNELYHNTTEQALNYRIGMKSEENRRNAVMGMAPDSTLLKTGTVLTSFAMQFIDPVNVLSGFVPVVGEARSAAMIANMGRYGGRAAIGAIEGTVGNALTEAIVYPAQQYIGADYTMADSLTSIAMGAPFGAVLHSLPEAFRDVRGAFNKAKAAQLAPESFADYNLPDIGEALDVPAVAAGRTADVAEQAWNDAADELRGLGIEIKQQAPESLTPAQQRYQAKSSEEKTSILSAENAKLDDLEGQLKPYEDGTYKDLSEEEIAYRDDLRDKVNRIRKNIEDYKKVDQSIEAQAKKIEDAAPDAMDQLINRAREMARGEIKAPVDKAPRFPFINELVKLGGVRVGSVLDQELRAMGVTPQQFRKLFKRDSGLTDVDNIPVTEWKASSARADETGNYVDRAYILDGIAREKDGNPIRPDGYVPPKSDEADLLAQLDRAGLDINSMSNRELRDAMDAIVRADEQGVDEKIFAASGQTRQAAMNAAIAQTIDGRPIDVEPILRTDARYGEEPPSPDELADMARPYSDEEGAAIDESVDSLLKEKQEDAGFNQADEYAQIPFGKSTAADVVSAVRTSFGKATEALLDAAKLRVVQGIDRLPKGIDYPADTKGVKLPDGTIYLVADNIEAAQVKGLVLHEAGVHLGMRSIMGNAKFNALLDDLMASTDRSVLEARKNVPKDTPSHQVAEETLAYLVENAPEAGVVRRIVSAIKAWAYNKFGLKFDIDEYTAREMAVGALKRVSKLGEGKSAEPFFSRTVDDVLKYDNPGGEWLANKQKYAEEDYAKGRKISGPVTGYTKVIDFPVSEAVKIKGANGENPVAGTFKFDALMESVKKDGFKDEGAILIGVNYKGEPYILEGNNRAAVANAIGKKTLKAEVKYYAGGEQANGSLTPQKLNQLLSPTEKTAAGEQAVIPGAERISDKELAERKMEQPLKAKKPQKEMDIGMFGDDAKQTVLFSRASKSNKYQPQLDLQLEKRVFDRALKDAEKYPTILRDAVKFANGNDDAGLRFALEDSGVTASMVTAVMQELKKQHVRVQNELRRQRKLIKTENAIDNEKSFDEIVAERTAQEIQERILTAKREAAFNFVARERAKLIVRDYGSFADEGFIATLTGSSMLREGARAHVSAYQSAYLKEWSNGIESALKKEGVFEQFTGRALERDVSKALEELDLKKPNFDGINADAVKIAKVMHKYQEATRITLNKLGAAIKYQPGYITRQSHDQLKIRGAGFESWAKDARGWFDFDRMGVKPNGINKALKNIWQELSSGTYQIEMPTEMKDADFRSGLNLAKKVSQSRSIIFKKGAWFDYNAKYGTRDVAAAYIRGIENSARVAGLMKMWGSNPEYNIGRAIDDMIEELRNSGDVDGASNLTNKRQKILNNLAVVDGSANIPGNVKGAQVASNIRLGQMMAKLGGALWSSMTDVPLYAANMRYEGRGNMFTGMAEAVKGIAAGGNSGVRAEVLKHLDVSFDHFIAETMHQYTKGAGFSQNMSALARIYTKFNLQQGWTSRLQKSAAYGFSNYLGDNASKAFAALSPEMKRIFKIHSIDEAKWDVLRGAVRNIEGKNYLVTDALDELGDDVIAKYITAKGRQVTPESIRNARERIGNDFRAMVIDRAESAALSGDKRVEAAMTGGTKRGTVWGEAIRFVGQFKSFPAMMIERVLKREIYGRGYDSMGDYMKRGKGDMLGLANLLVSMTLAGYVSLTIKDAIKGKSPRPLDRARTWTEAMAQGGFFGLYGDYVLNEYDNYSGRSFAASVLGPTIGGTVNDLFALKTAVENGDKTAVRALKIFQNNLPGANLFYVKPAMDYLFMYSLMENMNPGYLRRMEANSVRNTGQEWLIRPSSVDQ